MNNTEKAEAEENHHLVFEADLTRVIFPYIFLERERPTLQASLFIYSWRKKKKSPQLRKLFVLYAFLEENERR